MRLVLDTNIVYSALLWQGTAYGLLQTIRANPDLQLFSSLPLIEELADVLAQGKRQSLGIDKFIGRRNTGRLCHGGAPGGTFSNPRHQH